MSPLLERITNLANGFNVWEGPEYEKQMQSIQELIEEAYLQRMESFPQILEIGLMAISKNTGHHEALDTLESVLDKLFEKSIIDREIYEEVIRSSGCGRWL